MDILNLLKKNADEKYKIFSSSLIPNKNNILGVRLPVLRKLALQINDKEDFINNYKCHYVEEYMLKGISIGLLNKNAEELIKIIEKFIPYIDNWAVCDSFCASLKFVRNNQKIVWKFLKPYFKSDKEYEIRFAFVMLLNYFINDEYLDEIISLIDGFKNEKYYAKMACAWCFSVLYTKYPSKSLEYLKKSNLEVWTYNKCIQKTCESLKVDKQTKQMLKKLKRMSE